MIKGFKKNGEILKYDYNELGNLPNNVEPMEDDIPKVFFTGTAPTTKAEDELPLTMEYHSKTLNFKSYVTLKVQGDSSASYPKKNFNLKMFKDSEHAEKDKRVFRNWAKTHKFCLKANWIDITQARNVVNGRLWGQVTRTRHDYQNYPQEYIESTNCGAVDGFPIKVYLNGVYQGRYTWNIRKDESMWNMDDGLGTHSALIADSSTLTTLWREKPNIDGTDWTDELNDVVPDVILTSFRSVYDFVMNATDEEFKANIENHFYLSSLIDYYVFVYSILMYGGLAKSQTMLTYDGQKYLANIYDMDATWALHWDGQSFYNVKTPCPDGYSSQVENGVSNLLYERIATLFPEEIKARYAELRISVLSTGNIINEFERFMGSMPPYLVDEDYAPTTANGLFENIPSKETNNIQKLRDIIVKRMNYCDESILGGVESLHPLKSGTKTFSDGTAVTVNGNHVKISIAGMNANGEKYINLTDVMSNTDNVRNPENIKSELLWFETPMPPCSFETTISNIVLDDVDNISNMVFRMNYKKIDGSNMFTEPIIITSSEDVEVVQVLQLKHSVGSMYLYLSDLGTKQMNIEFDVNINVNGIRYV